MVSVTVHRSIMRVSFVGAVALGGAVGAVARYGLGEAFPIAAEAFPWTTFAINVVGSALLALLASRLRSEWVSAFVGPGVLGGFTTLSAYSEQSRALVDTGHTGLALLYLVGTLAACLVAIAIARRVATP